MLASDDCTTPLAKMMVSRAEADGLPPEHQVRVRAEELEQLAPDDDAKRILGRWARARRAWSDYTGEPLL